MKPIKDLGQNFLRDINTIKLFVQSCEIEDGDEIFEIGPGEGVLTKELLQNSKNFHLTTIDIDPRSQELLSEIKDQRLTVKTHDILRFIPEITSQSYKIIGAIPYNITSPILHKIIEKTIKPSKVVMIVQKEVGEKVCDSKKNSYLRLLINYFYETKAVQVIKKEAFFPAPKVDSILITLDLKLNLQKEISEFNVKEYEKFLHHLFRSPRKKINKVFSTEFLRSINIDQNLRPEDLSLNETIKIFKEFKNSP